MYPSKFVQRESGFALTLAFVAALLSRPLCDAGEEDRGIDFNQQIRPIFTQYCSACHGGVKQAGDVSFVYPEQVLPPSGWVIEPGDPEASLLIELVKTDDPDLRMPPPDEHPDPLPARQITLLEQWIAEGAQWGDHWSMERLPEKIRVEATTRARRWARQPMDVIVAARLAQHGLEPSPNASSRGWLRRASLDLVGLPPTVEQADDFASRCAAASSRGEVDALYAQAADRLLASMRFGERWASVWMDLARYADSKGFEKDPHRDMWPYRDWLIRAFNHDMPYDQFTIKQLAGDLLPAPTADDLIATSFHRNTQTNTEGGTDDEEFRVAAVIDRINTTWTVWQAGTFGCVQCHSHPYDPYRQEEYYAFMALLDNTQDADLDSDLPTLRIPADRDQVDAAAAAQLRYESVRRERNKIGRDLAGDVTWRPLRPTSVKTTGGRLKTDGDEVRMDGGTFPVGVSYTIEAECPPMTALRIDILPESSDPARWPEQGSILSHLNLAVVSADGTTRTIELVDAFADALTGPDDPRSCLNKKNKQGVGGYPKLHGPRWAVIVLKERLESDPDASLRLEMLQSANVTGNIATPIRRFRWSSCDDDAWTGLVESAELADLTRSLAIAKGEVDGIQGASLPVVLPRPASVARSTRRFIRGNWLERGEQVSPGIPAVFATRSDRDTIVVTDRLDLARWLVSNENPLAARVWANRIWAQLFGTGIVETLGDFGASGLQPSNPELLDHLAVRLRDAHAWRLKPLLREIVLSSTYRQTSDAPASLREKDPRNLLLSRGPRTRLSAEMIRDQALAVSGLLSDQVGGPSVMPPQPEGIWQAVYSGAKWTTPKGGQRYRRALYTYWRRTSPYPSFLMFDSPTRDLCSARRIATNTPLQALVTLNDPVFVECAQALAARALEKTGRIPREAITWMFLATTQRRPSESESKELQLLYDDLRVESSEVGGADDSLADLAALEIVANTILNLDKALTK